MPISKRTIKNYVKEKYKVRISDDAIDSIIKFLDSQAGKIAKEAVDNAKIKKHAIITPDDIEEAIIKNSVKVKKIE